jgi:hypothetical protein
MRYLAQKALMAPEAASNAEANDMSGAAVVLANPSFAAAKDMQ